MRRYKKAREYHWTNNIAYLVGLMASDGCLSSDGRHLEMTSKDLEQIQNFNKVLGREVRITTKNSGQGKRAYRAQFGDVSLYDFLVDVGLTPRKSKTIGALKVPIEFYADFLRGLFDGDGTVYGFWDSRWKSSWMFYMSFYTASEEFLGYLSHMNEKTMDIKGSVNKGPGMYRLQYAKSGSKKLFKFMYHDNNCIRLARKYEKAKSFILTDESARML